MTRPSLGQTQENDKAFPCPKYECWLYAESINHSFLLWKESFPSQPLNSQKQWLWRQWFINKCLTISQNSLCPCQTAHFYFLPQRIGQKLFNWQVMLIRDFLCTPPRWLQPETTPLQRPTTKISKPTIFFSYIEQMHLASRLLCLHQSVLSAWYQLFWPCDFQLPPRSLSQSCTDCWPKTNLWRPFV